MIVVVSKYLVPKKRKAITLCPFVIVRHGALKKDVILMNHEQIHIRQQIELLIIPFYLIYGAEFLVRLIITRDTEKAYRSISFEREAYYRESDLNYLKKRKFWAWVKRIKE